MSDARGPTAPSRRVLRIITAGLEEIEGQFGWGREDTGQDEESLGADNGAAEDADKGTDGDPYEESFYTAGFDRESVEIAIDRFLSHLILKRLIRINESDELPSLSDVFEKVFGKKHEIVKTAVSFEQHIEGYFGWIAYEHMRAAYSEILEIKALIEKELERSGSVENNELFDTDHPR